MLQSIPNGLIDQVKSKPPGSVFVPTDFAGVGPATAVARGLGDLSRQGVVRRLGQGLYDLPEWNRFIGGVVSPSPDAIADALARRTGSRVQVSGARAANILGLSTQVPAKPVYLTDGPSRSITLGKQIIRLYHVGADEMLGAGHTSGMVLQALRHLGPNHVDAATLSRLQRILTHDDRLQLRAFAKSVPPWMADIIARVTG